MTHNTSDLGRDIPGQSFPPSPERRPRCRQGCLLGRMLTEAPARIRHLPCHQPYQAICSNCPSRVLLLTSWRLIRLLDPTLAILQSYLSCRKSQQPNLRPRLDYPNRPPLSRTTLKKTMLLNPRMRPRCQRKRRLLRSSMSIPPLPPIPKSAALIIPPRECGFVSRSFTVSVRSDLLLPLQCDSASVGFVCCPLCTTGGEPNRVSDTPICRLIHRLTMFNFINVSRHLPCTAVHRNHSGFLISVLSGLS